MCSSSVTQPRASWRIDREAATAESVRDRRGQRQVLDASWGAAAATALVLGRRVEQVPRRHRPPVAGGNQLHPLGDSESPASAPAMERTCS